MPCGELRSARRDLSRVGPQVCAVQDREMADFVVGESARGALDGIYFVLAVGVHAGLEGVRRGAADHEDIAMGGVRPSAGTARPVGAHRMSRSTPIRSAIACATSAG